MGTKPKRALGDNREVRVAEDRVYAHSLARAMLGRGLEDAQRVEPEVLHAEQVRRHDRDAQRAREGHRVDACAVRM